MPLFCIKANGGQKNKRLEEVSSGMYTNPKEL